VDVGESLKWVLDTCLNGGGVDRTNSRDGDGEDVSKALIDLVSIKIMEGGSRKGSTLVTEVGLRSFPFSEAFIANLPPALQRKCVAQRLEGCPRCRMKGFALDVWYTGASYLSPVPLISTAQDFLEIFPASTLVPPPSSSSSSSSPSADGTHSDLTLVIFQVHIVEKIHENLDFDYCSFLYPFFSLCVRRVTGRPYCSECPRSSLTARARRIK
jgi:hypothetical protein